MRLIQILLPLYDNRGKKLPRKHYERVQSVLTKQFHGLTAYTRAPAKGLWKSGTNVFKDQIIIYEVITPSLHRPWWKRYRSQLEKLFRQKEIVIRSQEVVVL